MQHVLSASTTFSREMNRFEGSTGHCKWLVLHTVAYVQKCQGIKSKDFKYLLTLNYSIVN